MHGSSFGVLILQRAEHFQFPLQQKAFSIAQNYLNVQHCSFVRYLPNVELQRRQEGWARGRSIVADYYSYCHIIIVLYPNV